MERQAPRKLGKTEVDRVTPLIKIPLNVLGVFVPGGRKMLSTVFL